MIYRKEHVPIPTIGQDCDAHVRLDAQKRVHWCAIYDRTRETWHTSVGQLVLTAALRACQVTA